MALTITKIHAKFGAEVGGVRLAEPVDDRTFAAITDAFNEYSVLVFHDQPLTDEEQIAFSVRFGPLEQHAKSVSHNPRVSRDIADLSNVDPDGNVIPPDDQRMLYHMGNQLWHTDSSFKRVPATASLLSGRECPPEGAETEFASMRTAYEALPVAMKERLEELIAVHSFAYSRSLIAPGLLTPEQQAALPPVPQRLVRANPVPGRKSIYIGSHASHIIGMGVAESRALLRELLELTTRPDNVYAHTWRAGDLVMWDNCCMLHRGRPWDYAKYRRVMHRTTVAGIGPTVTDDIDVAVPAAR